MLARRRDLFPAFVADVIRLRQSMLGRCLPAISVGDLLQHKGVYSVSFGIGGRDFDDRDALLLAKLLAMLRPKRIFEICTSLGLTALFMAR